MSSRDKFYGVRSADKGFDDVGVSQPTGSFSGATLATQFGARYAGKTKIALGSTAYTLRPRQPINLTANDSYLTGLTSVLKVLGPTQVIVNKTFTSGATSGTGSFDTLGGEGSWDAFQPIGADLNATGMSNITFWKTGQQGSNEKAVSYTKDQIYHFPNGIKTMVLISTNVRLFRAATLRPAGLTAQ